MKFLFLTVGGNKEKWSEISTDLYLEKLKPFVSFEVKVLKPSSHSRASISEKIIQDSKILANQLEANDLVILFDESGRNLNSELWAKELEKTLNSGKKRVIWIIGGPYGVSDDLKKRAQLKLSLAPFVMNHLVARTVALEQIYRAFTINKNLPYHNK